MKTYLTILILTVSILKSQANTYYLSTTTGNDSYSITQAQHPATPWNSLAKLNSMIRYLKKGDIILFKRNETFFGSLQINGTTTPVSFLSFGSYGAGAPPKISGLTDIDKWKNVGTNVWKAHNINIKTINNVVINGTPKPVGRYPNADAINSGYLNIQTHTGKLSITTKQLAKSVDMTGAEAVVRTRRWILDRSVVKKISNTTLLLDKALTHEPENNFGFFMQNNLHTLDRPGEWYFDQNTHELFLYSLVDPAHLHIEVSVIETLFSFTNAHNITINDLTFTGAANAAVEFKGGSHLNLSNLAITNSGMNAIVVLSSGFITIEKCNIHRAYNNGIAVSYTNNVTIADNVLTNICTVPGMGAGGDIQYMAISVTGSNTTIANNRIDSVGYIGVYFDGDHIMVQNNRISNFCLVKDDGGGIYSFSNLTFQPNRIIRNNIISNGIGMANGTPYATPFAAGIYLDDNASNIIVKKNTVSHCSHSGIYIRNSSNTKVTENLIFDNGAQLKFMNDQTINTTPIKHTAVYNNTIISRYHNQPLLDFNLSEASVSDVGTFTNNRYILPSRDSLQIRIQSIKANTITRKLVTPLNWKKDYRKDTLSSFAILPFQPVYMQATVQDNLITPYTADKKTQWLSAWSRYNNISLKPLTPDAKVYEIAFNKMSPDKASNGNNSVFTQQFSLTKGKQYALQFNVQSSVPEKDVYIKIREDKNSRHAALEDFVIATGTTTAVTKFFTANVNYDSARVYFELSEDSAHTRLGTIELHEIRYGTQNVLDVLNLYTNATSAPINVNMHTNGSQPQVHAATATTVLPPYSSVIDWKTLQQVESASKHLAIQGISIQSVNRWQSNFTLVFICLIAVSLLMGMLLKKKYWFYTAVALAVFITTKVYFFDENVAVINDEVIVLDIDGIKINNQHYRWQQIIQVSFYMHGSKEPNVVTAHASNNTNYITLQVNNGDILKKNFTTTTLAELSNVNQFIDLLSFYNYPIQAKKL